MLNDMSPIEAVNMEDFKSSQTNEERIFDIILQEDDLTWKDLIMDLVRNENMDPWNVDISLLTEKFLFAIQKLKEMNFRIGGKIVLASSLLLKLKSDRLVGEDMQNFEQLLLAPVDLEENAFIEESSFEYEQKGLDAYLNDQKKLMPRTPQPRERMVSVFDLVDALEKALETDFVKQRRKILRAGEIDENQVRADNENYFDLGKTMKEIHNRIAKLFLKNTTKIFFDELVVTNDKSGKVYTFLPLLHLETQRKIDLEQKEHFGQIQVKILNNNF